MFSERGFAAARLEDIASRAGVSKAALYIYFPTKTDLFRAVVDERALPNIQAMEQIADQAELPLDILVPTVLRRMAVTLENRDLRAVAKMVIGESGNFPELAQVWHATVVARALGLMTRMIARCQARGEARGGDPRLLALSLVGPMMMGGLWREVMEPVGGAPLDLAALAAEHTRTVLEGMRLQPAEPAP